MKRVMWVLVIVAAVAVAGRAVAKEAAPAASSMQELAPAGDQSHYEVPASNYPDNTSSTTQPSTGEDQTSGSVTQPQSGTPDQVQSSPSDQSSSNSSSQTQSTTTDQSQTSPSGSQNDTSTMPKTASPLPLVGLAGLLALSGSLVLSLRRKPS